MWKVAATVGLTRDTWQIGTDRLTWPTDCSQALRAREADTEPVLHGRDALGQEDKH